MQNPPFVPESAPIHVNFPLYPKTRNHRYSSTKTDDIDTYTNCQAVPEPRIRNRKGSENPDAAGKGAIPQDGAGFQVFCKSLQGHHLERRFRAPEPVPARTL